MRRKNRELSPFGMSSLDLFASALGAFILISIIIFPLISETTDEMLSDPTPLVVMPEPIECPVCPSVVTTMVAEPVSCPVCPTVPAPVPCPEVAAPDAVCPVCPICESCPDPEPAACPPQTVVVQAAAQTYQLPHVDLVIALDVTSSMGRQVAALKAEVGQLSDLLSRMAPSFGIGMVAFGDRYWEQPVISFPLRQISGPTLNRAAFRGFVNNLSVRMGLGGGGNTDPPEAFFQALVESARMPWRGQAERRVIVLVTDSPAYPEESEQAVAAAAAIARQRGHRVSTVYINSQGVADAEVVAFLQRVASAGGGQFVRDVGGSLTVNLLLSLL